MKESNYGTSELPAGQLAKINGGHPILVVLGVVTTAVSIGRAVDQAGEWFLEGWNDPK